MIRTSGDRRDSFLDTFLIHIQSQYYDAGPVPDVWSARGISYIDLTGVKTYRFSFDTMGQPDGWPAAEITIAISFDNFQTFELLGIIPAVFTLDAPHENPVTFVSDECEIADSQKTLVRLGIACRTGYTSGSAYTGSAYHLVIQFYG